MVKQQHFLIPSRNNVLLPDTRGGSMRLLPSVRHGYKTVERGLNSVVKQASSIVGGSLADKLQRLQISKQNKGGSRTRVIGMLR